MSRRLRKRRFLYRAKAVWVLEGNLIDFMVDCGLFCTLRISVQVQGLELPYLRDKDDSVRVIAQNAKDCAMKIVLDRWVLLETSKEEKRPRFWKANVFLDAQTEHKGLRVEHFGRPMVNYSHYMSYLRESNFSKGEIDLDVKDFS